MWCQRCRSGVFETLFRCVIHDADGSKPHCESRLADAGLQDVLTDCTNEGDWLNWFASLEKQDFSVLAKSFEITVLESLTT